MALERGTFQWGGTVFPVATGTGNSALQDLDPAIFYALDFWSTVLQAHLGARWQVEATNQNRADIAAAIVQDKKPYDPADYLNETQVKFPLLAVYRVSSKDRELTAVWEHTESVWNVDYVLPPMTAGELENIGPFLFAVFRVLVQRTTNGADPSYQSNAQVWSASFAGIEEVAFESCEVGNWKSAAGLTFPTMHAVFRCVERQKVPAGAFDPLNGTDISENLVSSDGTTITNVVQIKT